MKKSLITLIGVLTVGAALPAVAEPNWQLIEQGRKARLAQIEKERVAQVQRPQTSGSSSPQQTDNDSQKQRMMKECADMMKKAE